MIRSSLDNLVNSACRSQENISARACIHSSTVRGLSILYLRGSSKVSQLLERIWLRISKNQEADGNSFEGRIQVRCFRFANDHLVFEGWGTFGVTNHRTVIALAKTRDRQIRGSAVFLELKGDGVS